MRHSNFKKFSQVCPEFVFSAARSGGPGGQHVNKTETKIELRWKFHISEVLNLREKETIDKKLSRFINGRGELIITSSLTRSQKRNQDDCVKKLQDALDRAFFRPPPRKKTKPSRSAQLKNRKRREAHSEKKQARRKIKP